MSTLIVASSAMAGLCFLFALAVAVTVRFEQAERLPTPALTTTEHPIERAIERAAARAPAERSRAA